MRDRFPGRGWSARASRSSIAVLDEFWTVSGSGGDTAALIDTIERPKAILRLKARLGGSMARIGLDA